MEKLKSVFGTYAERLQVMVDTAQDRFSKTWFQDYFDFGTPTTSLTFVTAIGRSRVEAAASIVDRDGKTPIRSRQGLEKLTGEVPAIKEMFKMSDKDYRDFLTLQQMSVSDEVKKRQLLDLMFNDTKKVGESAMKRLDIMCLEAVSTGKITVTTANNPDGIVAPMEIDLLMPAINRQTSAAVWSDPINAKPVTDLNNVVNIAQGAGKSFGKIMMSRSKFLQMSATVEVRNMVSGFLRINSKEQVNPTFAQLNDYLQANLLPVIVLVDQVVGVEADGVIKNIRPFAEESVVFVPDGKLGVIHNAVAIESLRPVSGVAYATFNNALISKWSQNEPFGEYTKVELNAFPGVEAIDGIFILKTTI